MRGSRQPVISVAIATRNYGRYLPRALDSVLRCHNPTDAPIQVVVADDASTDNTRAVIADYCRRYPENLEPLFNRATTGMGPAKNAALERCIGRTVALLDADDEFLPEKLLHCHAALEQGGADFLTCNFYHQHEEGPRLLRDRHTWTHPLWFPSTWVFRNGVVRFNEHSNGADDLDWWERRIESVRHRHLDLALNVQHVHAGPYGMAWDSLIPARQMSGRLLHQPHPYDRLAPSVWACRCCGDQYLLPTRCCGRAPVARPLLFYWTIRSPHCRPRPEFSLVIPTHNGLSLTRRAVHSILARVPVGRPHLVELIFVDGSSTDGTLAFIREVAQTAPVKLIVTHPAEPFVFGRACNRGVRAATGKYVLLLNNDIELCSDDPWGAMRPAFEDPRVGIVGASTVWSGEQRDPDWPAGSPPYRFVDRPLQGYFWGARREVYWELGGVDEAFVGHGYDELDLEYRALLAHYRLALTPLRVAHASHGTYEPAFGAVGMKQLAEGNRQLFVRKHGRSIYMLGERVEPFASHQPARLSVVITARNDERGLRETLAGAMGDPGCQDGTVQVVVVDNGSTDATALLLEEYRLRLSASLTVISLAEGLAPARARQIGRARAIGARVCEIAPGEWRPSRGWAEIGSV